jgi:ATP-dependent Lhr-like helicase
VLGPAQQPEARAERLIRVLLARYGVLVRECLAREDLPWEWAQLYPLLERMEMRGEVRRGYFVAGLSGLQFALPGAIERLRESAAAAQKDDAIVVLSAMDPALVDGVEQAEALRFTRVPSTHVALIGGTRAAVFADHGERISMADALAPAAIERIVAAYLARPYAERRVAVSQWNGARVLGGPGQAVLKALGFDRTPDGMEKR